MPHICSTVTFFPDHTLLINVKFYSEKQVKFDNMTICMLANLNRGTISSTLLKYHLPSISINDNNIKHLMWKHLLMTVLFVVIVFI